MLTATSEGSLFSSDDTGSMDRERLVIQIEWVWQNKQKLQNRKTYTKLTEFLPVLALFTFEKSSPLLFEVNLIPSLIFLVHTHTLMKPRHVPVISHSCLKI